MADAGEIKTYFETATLTHPNTTTETDLVEYIGLRDLLGISLDMTNILQTTTIRVYNKTDSTNYRQRSQKVFPTDYETGTEEIFAELDGTGQDMKITLESGTVEGSAKNIPADIRTGVRL